MARVKEIYYGMMVTVNLGNYESVKVELGQKVELSPEDDAKKELSRLVRRIKETVTEDAEACRQEFSKEDKPKKK